MTTRCVARRWWIAPLLLLALVACGPATSTATPPAPATATASAGTTSAPSAPHNVMITVANRPFQLHIPGGYHQGTAAPLVVMLHGYTSSGSGEEGYLKITAESDKRGFLYATPDGTTESAGQGQRFWNATDACCNFYRSTVDDSGYISSIITTVGQQYTVDSKRVYLIGHSNGAFMSYRMACDHADQITAIVSLAGAMWSDTSKCHPRRPVSVLEVHGTADERIAYQGDSIVGVPYPPVTTTVADWRGFDGCADGPTAGTALDLVATLPGAETTVATYSARCKAKTRVELWTMAGAVHVPRFTPNFAPAALDFLYAQVAA